MIKRRSYSFFAVSIISMLTLLFIAYSCKTTEYVGGIQINEASQEEWAKTINACGMNTAQVTAYAKQGAWNSDHLWWEDSDTTHVIAEIRALKAQKVKVVMVLRVALQHEYQPNMYKWHGMIYPTSKDQMKEWLYRYGCFVEMWAKICEREGVDVLAIASEMNALSATQQIDSLPPLIEYFSNQEKQLQHELKIVSFEDQLRKHDLWEYGQQVDANIEPYLLAHIESNISWTKEAFQIDQANHIDLINQDRRFLDSTWRSIIYNTRKHYKGKITMAANFDSYHEVSFWDELDFIGINAYFSLRNIHREPQTDEAIYDELVLGWESVFRDISALKTANQLNDKPIFFTEIGYTKKQGCTLAPWGGEGYTLLSTDELDTLLIWKDAIDKPEERIMAIDALHQVMTDQKIPLIGLNYWKLTSHAYHEGYEPFMLYINENEVDGLQSALARFLVRGR